MKAMLDDEKSHAPHNPIFGSHLASCLVWISYSHILVLRGGVVEIDRELVLVNNVFRWLVLRFPRELKPRI